MSDTSVDPNRAFVRAEMLTARPAPGLTVGPIAWMRENLASSPGNFLLTLVGILILYKLIPPVIEFAFIKATWTGTNGADCRIAGFGACWPYVVDYLDEFAYGRYPFAERWRVNTVFVLFFALMVPLMIPKLPHKGWNALAFFGIFPVVAFFLLVGSPTLGLPIVETRNWGGLLVTLVVAVTGIVASLPMGILLALGRRSKMPIIRLLSVVYIEVWRGVPLITVLFMANTMLPLFVHEGQSIDNLLRALIGVAFFSAAYMAEVVRGGLQAIPKGQYEGAMALGLSYWKMMLLIILPQALKLVIPGIVNTFIGLFKDTTLVAIVGLFDLLGMIQATRANPVWAAPTTMLTGYLVAAIVYFTFCYGMSRYSQYMERRLATGHKR
ncbi:MAG: amino acid ABC transporter permease [Hyphomicrobiaceae bacterium]|nr:amino acid ABC transporter permease [Hyphomicrobiaceae bacterium]